MIFEKNPEKVTKILQSSVVGIAGCGGLGSNAAAALTRAGIGTLILADFDSVEPSNLNRQYFFQPDTGKRKTDALATHLKAINPEIKLNLFPDELTPDNVPAVFKNADLLIEAFDKSENKLWLIETWCSAFPDKPLISGNGVAGYGRTEALKIRRNGNLILCGDGESDTTMGLCAARVAIVANMQANEAIEILMNRDRQIK